MLDIHKATVQRYYETVVSLGLWNTSASLEQYLNFLFQDVQIEGKAVLDIGGGVGVFSSYAAVQGASQVVCLEPEADGGSIGMREKFDRIAGELGLTNVRLVPKTFQQFETEPGKFDIILLHNSVNHLDEDACIQLRKNKSAVEHYMNLFTKLATLVSDKGVIIVTDVTPVNFFPLIGLKHPINKGIEWHKHQPPRVWAQLLQRVGFGDQTILWSSYNRLGKIGWLLFANRIGAFFLKGHFRLKMSKQSGS